MISGKSFLGKWLLGKSINIKSAILLFFFIFGKMYHPIKYHLFKLNLNLTLTGLQHRKSYGAIIGKITQHFAPVRV